MNTAGMIEMGRTISDMIHEATTGEETEHLHRAREKAEAEEAIRTGHDVMVSDRDFELKDPYALGGYACYWVDAGGERDDIEVEAHRLGILPAEYFAGLQGKEVKDWMADNARAAGVEDPWSDAQFLSQYSQVAGAANLVHPYSNDVQVDEQGRASMNQSFSVQKAMGDAWGSNLVVNQVQNAVSDKIEETLGESMPGMDEEQESVGEGVRLRAPSEPSSEIRDMIRGSRQREDDGIDLGSLDDEGRDSVQEEPQFGD